jgi:collagen type VII alpha
MKHIAYLFAIVLLAAVACKKENTETLPTVETVSIIDVTAHTVKITLRVTDEGGTQVTGAGVCWAKMANPDLTNNVSNVGQGLGEFISILTNLDTNTTYYVRAFATNSVGTSYGNNLTFTTAP